MMNTFYRLKTVLKGLKIFYKGSKFIGKSIYKVSKLQRFGPVYLSSVFILGILINMPRAYKQHKIYRTINSQDNYGFYERYREMQLNGIMHQQ